MKQGVRLSVGGSSILVIFVILTLITFATLSVVSATADKNLSDKARVFSDEYYAADARAEDILAEIGGAIAPLSGSGAEALAAAEAAVSGIEGVSCRAEGGALLIDYTVEVNPVQNLVVALSVSADRSITRNQWKIVSTITEEEDAEAELNLWDFADIPA
jgi:hypothetical protein